LGARPFCDDRVDLRAAVVNAVEVTESGDRAAVLDHRMYSLGI